MSDTLLLCIYIGVSIALTVVAGYMNDGLEEDGSADYEAGFMAGAAAERERGCDPFIVDGSWYKSACGKTSTDEPLHWNFCPYCGGKIVVNTKEEK